MFIAIQTYKNPFEGVDHFLQVIKADNRAAVDTIISQDPFNINGIADYQIVEFTPILFITYVLKTILG